jgi:hypothetical protein
MYVETLRSITLKGIMTKFKSLRDPIMVGQYRLFGDILPFIGFETIEASAEEIADYYDVSLPEDVDLVYGNFFTIEWLGKGMSTGGFSVPTED